MVGHNVLRIGRYFVSLCADSAPKAGNTVGSDLLIKPQIRNYAPNMIQKRK